MPKRIEDPWGTRMPYGPGEPWPVRVDEHLAEGVDAARLDRWAVGALARIGVGRLVSED